MKKLLPLVMLLLGLGGGVGAGMVLKPPAEEAHATACGPAAPADGHAAPAAHGSETAATTEPCPQGEADPFAAPAAEHGLEGELSYVPLKKPFVVPVFSGERTVAMVVVSLSVETDLEGAHLVEAAQPRLRDSFLKVMFRHANSGGFDGSFTAGQKIEDLKAALLASARSVMGESPVGEVLITEIARQET